MPTITDLIAFRQAEAGGWIDSDNKLCPTEPDCDDCPFDKQCDALDGSPLPNTFHTLPEWLLSLAELRTLYPEFFI